MDLSHNLIMKLFFPFQVFIFSLLEDSKFEHFKPVMDAYITGHFAAALVYKYVPVLLCFSSFYTVVGIIIIHCLVDS